MKYYLVDEQELIELLNYTLTLQALAYGGVDNWDGYYDSICDLLNSYKEENNIQDKVNLEDITKVKLSNYDYIEK